MFLFCFDHNANKLNTMNVFKVKRKNIEQRLKKKKKFKLT